MAITTTDLVSKSVAVETEVRSPDLPPLVPCPAGLVDPVKCSVHECGGMKRGANECDIMK